MTGLSCPTQARRFLHDQTPATVFLSGLNNPDSRDLTQGLETLIGDVIDTNPKQVLYYMWSAMPSGPTVWEFNVATNIHFIAVGQGNMVLVQCSSGTNFVVDCNITDANKDRVLNYVAKQVGVKAKLHAFICTHRDADHMRGVRTLHNRFPIGRIWDSGYPGTTTDSDEYRAYMQLRRDVGSKVIEKKTKNDYGYTRLRYFSAKDGRLPKNANDQGIVVKVEELNAVRSKALSSTILTGDGSYATWKDGIMKDYSKDEVSCSILMAAHHGSLDFFDDPNDSRYYYTSHIKAIKPTMVVVSVGENNFGHPDSKALELYRKFATGLDNGNKVFRTDQQHSMKLVLKSAGGWSLTGNQ